METVIINTWADYQAAAMRTCTESSRNNKYMALGLMSEAGEVAGKIAKHVRDDNGGMTVARAEAIIYELGDVLWMIAGIQSINNTDKQMREFFDKAGLLEHEAYHLYAKKSLEQLAAKLTHKCAATGTSVLLGKYNRHWFEFESIVKIITTIAWQLGYSLQDLCQRNIDKLTERYNRNTIHGSGDNR